MPFAIAGQPIQLLQRYMYDLLQRANNGDWTFTMIHEMGHNFDPFGWSFQGEFMANLMIAYIMCQRNATVYLGNQRRTGLAQYRDYFRASHAYYFSRETCPDYDPFNDPLLYTFLRIQQRIGWQPFQNAFRHIEGLLVVNSLPGSDLNNLNLFLTLLRDYSGVDVINTILTPIERERYGDNVGGDLEYLR